MKNKPSIKIAVVSDHDVTVEYTVQFYAELDAHTIVERHYYRSGTAVFSPSKAMATEQLFDGDDRGGDYLVHFTESEASARQWVESAMDPDEVLRFYCRKYSDSQAEAEQIFDGIKAYERLHLMSAPTRVVCVNTLTEASK